MKRGWLIILLLSLGLNVGLGLSFLRRPALAPSLPSHGDPHLDRDFPGREQAQAFMRHRLERLTRELDLTQDQQERFWALHLESGDQVMERRTAMFAARRHLHEAYAGPDPDIHQIHRIQREMSAMQAELDSSIVDIMFKERAILTPEQRGKYRVMFPGGREAPGKGRRDGRGRHQGSHGQQD